jgi:hypothetical protein
MERQRPKHQRVHLLSEVMDTKREELLFVTGINMREITLKWDVESKSKTWMPLASFDKHDHLVIADEMDGE